MPALDELFSLLDDPASLSDAEIEAAQHDLRQHAVGVRDGGIEVDDPVDALSTIPDYFEGSQYLIDSREESAQRRDADLESASQRLGLPALGTLTPPASHSPAARVQVGEPRIMRP